MISMPIEGHLEQISHMFAYLRMKHNRSIVFYPTEPDIDDSHSVRENWSVSAYGECKEELPPNDPQSKVIGFTMRSFIDSDHAG